MEKGFPPRQYYLGQIGHSELPKEQGRCYTDHHHRSILPSRSICMTIYHTEAAWPVFYVRFSSTPTPIEAARTEKSPVSNAGRARMRTEVGYGEPTFPATGKACRLGRFMVEASGIEISGPPL
jgi:hypothetical protein